MHCNFVLWREFQVPVQLIYFCLSIIHCKCISQQIQMICHLFVACLIMQCEFLFLTTVQSYRNCFLCMFILPSENGSNSVWLAQICQTSVCLYYLFCRIPIEFHKYSHKAVYLHSGLLGMFLINKSATKTACMLFI